MDPVLELYTALNERPLRHIMAKQRNITQLFPKFNDRVNAITSAELVEETPGLWHFKVTAVTTPNVDFWDVYVQFRDIVLKIQHYGASRETWSGDHIDTAKLADKIMTNGDMRIWCSCPCNQYWGFAYIQTDRMSKYGDPENRKPRVRNPDQRGIACKHLQKVFNRLPTLKGTLAGHLKRFFSKDIQSVEQSLKAERAMFKGATAALAKREEERPISYTRGGKEFKGYIPKVTPVAKGPEPKKQFTKKVEPVKAVKPGVKKNI